MPANSPLAVDAEGDALRSQQPDVALNLIRAFFPPTAACDRDAFAAKMVPVYVRLESRWGTDNWKRVRAEIDRMRSAK
jgi:hypothetical protein